MGTLASPVNQKISQEEFGVGWICALTTEWAASFSMLDEEYPDSKHPDRADGDQNPYILGKISGHRVVMTCLTQYGSTTAARAVYCMRQTFKCLHSIVLVGIGGGAPSEENDVRLGDIVVGLKVAQYDLGSAMGDGTYEIGGDISKPPNHLLSAIQRVRAQHHVDGQEATGSITTALDRMFTKNPTMRNGYSRPPIETDPLHLVGERPYPGNSSSSDSDHGHINRKPRVEGLPWVHYGLIASGNTVIKDEKHRDEISSRISRRHRCKPLCYEMEAAGVMDENICLVIRGISDYCDSHKNDMWQKSAAAAAAAFAKVFLKVVPFTIRPRIDSFSSYSNPQDPYTPLTDGFSITSLPKSPQGSTLANGINSAPELGLCDIDLAANRPNFVFKFPASRKASDKSNRGPVAAALDVASMNPDPQTSSLLKAYGIVMKAFEKPLPAVVSSILSYSHAKQRPFTLPIFEFSDTGIGRTIKDWAAPVKINFNKFRSTEIDGDVQHISSHTGSTSQTSKPIPVKVNVRIINPEQDRNVKLKESETPFAIIAFSLGKEDSQKFQRKCVEWSQKVAQFIGWVPSLIVLGLTNGFHLPEDRCFEASRSIGASLHINVATRNTLARNIFFNTVIGYATASICHTQNGVT